MNFNDEERNFLDYLRVEKGLAENTLIAYQRDLNRFAEYLASRDINLQELTPNHIVEYQQAMRLKDFAESSTNRSISTLRTFFGYLGREKQFPNPMGEIEKSRQTRRLPKALTVSEVLSLIDVSFREGEPLTLRNRALLELLYGTGARVSEIVDLDVSDFYRAETEGQEIETIKLRGKGHKERIVPLGSFASAAVQEYLIRVRPDLALKSKVRSSALFLNQRGSRLTRQSAWQFVMEAATAVGLEGKVSPHVFRHSYATHLLDGGADIRVVQELLGHASVTTTQIYTLVTIDKVRESYSLAHPRARE
jgi:integrase/recombinase XerD